MHIVENKSAPKSGRKIYRSILLRESYREDGKVKKRTIANLSHCTPGEIAALKLALKHKDDLTDLRSLKESIQLQEGLSVGAVWTVYQVAKQLKIDQALGKTIQGKLGLWQVMARVLHQGSRLSAVRLAQTQAACDVLDIRRGFDENDLYNNLKWLSAKQAEIEQALFSLRRGNKRPELFLYDVTSSYLEGQQNVFGAYGYNRDGKKSKQQIVIGLLCDEQGDPVSTEVFAGNTQDPQTFNSQIRKVTERFGCKRVTFVGDRGMIKRAQIEQLPEGVTYITAITKPQIKSLLKEGVIQISLFDDELCEVEAGDVRYILRRNPNRAKELAASRRSKLQTVQELVNKKNTYLKEHPRAKLSTAEKGVEARLKSLKIDPWVIVKHSERILLLEIAQDVLKDVSLLDGCYVLKTDLTEPAVSKQVIHDRYLDLTQVERAFRTSKTELLEIRPVFVRTESSTRGHVFVVMLAYLIARRLRQLWVELDVTVKEGLQQLTTLSSIEVKVKNNGSCLKIPRPRKNSRELLKALNIRMPLVLPHRNVPVVTRKKIKSRRNIDK